VKEIERYRDLFINREDAYATQRMDGSYICRKEEVTDKVLVDHLKGRITCGWYCLSKDNQIKWACVDADSEDGQKLLQRVSQRLKGLEIPSYIEESREGRGHLWIFLEPLAAKHVRKVLERVVEEGMEVFPKQNRISRKGYGSLVRGPLGIHLKTGKRYGFLDPETLERVGKNLSEQFEYLEKVIKVDGVTIGAALAEVLESHPGRKLERKEWERPEADVVAVAGLFTDLKDRGHYYTGLCPLHPESHHSFAVYPNPGDVGRWVCFHEYKVGDAVGLYAEVKGISYKDALRELRKMGLIRER
jgi:hypothetical protein